MELTALPQPPTWIGGRDKGKVEGVGKEEWKEMNRE